jgi:peptidoglycan hydrolase-like protein with peptidoglycan-binding domain
MKNRYLFPIVMFSLSTTSLCILQESVIAGYSPCKSSNQYSSYCFKEGDSGTEIKYLSEDLKMLGYYTGSATSVFNRTLKNAVRKFQSDYGKSRGLGKADGIVGEKTLLAICQASRKGCSPTASNGCYTGSVLNISSCLDRYK